MPRVSCGNEHARHSSTTQEQEILSTNSTSLHSPFPAPAPGRADLDSVQPAGRQRVHHRALSILLCPCSPFSALSPFSFLYSPAFFCCFPCLSSLLLLPYYPRSCPLPLSSPPAFLLPALPPPSSASQASSSSSCKVPVGARSFTFPGLVLMGRGCGPGAGKPVWRVRVHEYQAC